MQKPMNIYLKRAPKHPFSMKILILYINLFEPNNQIVEDGRQQTTYWNGEDPSPK